MSRGGSKYVPKLYACTDPECSNTVKSWHSMDLTLAAKGWKLHYPFLCPLHNTSFKRD